MGFLTNIKYDIVRDKTALSVPCLPCNDIEKGVDIGQSLLEYLAQIDQGLGLAANQVGLSYRVCVLCVVRPIILVNPKIIEKSKKIYFQEACLSFPGDYILTERYASIVVKADNHLDVCFFNEDINILECVCVQHEIDHLDGITMYERQIGNESSG